MDVVDRVGLAEIEVEERENGIDLLNFSETIVLILVLEWRWEPSNLL
jgi:hypothetical protein